jgi:hypothetical protein
MDVTFDFNLIINSLMIAALMFVAKLLWQVSSAVKQIQVTQEAHELLDQSRFESVHQRIGDLRGEVRSELRGMR